MLFHDSKQQLPVDSLSSMPIDLSNASIRRDEFSEIVANMTKTLHVNTPEQTVNNININELDEDEDEEEDYKRQELIDQLKTQLIRNQIQRTQARNYTRILNQSNTPAQWYNAPAVNRSVYFYDPHYQNYLQQRTKSPPKIKSNIPSNGSHAVQNRARLHPARNNWFSVTPRTKYMLDLYNTAVSYHQQKQPLKVNQDVASSNTSTQRIPTANRTQSTTVLPPINSTKQRKEHELHLLNTQETDRQSLITGLRKK